MKKETTSKITTWGLILICVGVFVLMVVLGVIQYKGGKRHGSVYRGIEPIMKKLPTTTSGDMLSGTSDTLISFDTSPIFYSDTPTATTTPYITFKVEGNGTITQCK